MGNTETDKCPICQLPARFSDRSASWVTVNCPNCGRFKLTDMAELEIPNHLGDDTHSRALASHYIRKQGLGNFTPKLYTDSIEEYLLRQFPTIQEQANNLLLFLAESTGEIGEVIHIVRLEHWTALCGAKSAKAVAALIDFLISENFIQKEDYVHGSYAYSVTFKGWQRYEELQSENKDSTIAFMAMQFGDTELDKIVDGIFRPAVAQTGFRLQKLTDGQRAGLIDDQLRVQIRRARILIADLTHSNNGAYWEAGFAEGLGIPVIYTCKQSIFDDPEKKPHFDTNHYLTVPWDPDNLQAASDKLKVTIRATLPETAKMEDD